MDQYFEVSSFRYLNNSHCWYHFTFARVEFILSDIKRDRIIVLLIDKNREKMMAVIPSNLMEIYQNRILVGLLYSIKCFKLSWNPFGCPKYGGYKFLDDEYVIAVSDNTQFNLERRPDLHFPLYPLVTSIESLVKMQRLRLMIDVVGKVISGRFLGRNCAYEMTLQDKSGYVINLTLNDAPETLPFMLSLAIRDHWVIYVARVKLCEQGGHNYLSSTYISRVRFRPIMPEAEEISLIYG